MSIQGPCTEDLVISPKPGYKIAGSDISMQDAKLWRNIEKTPEKHTYQIVNAYSSQEFVHIDGTVTKPAPGSGGKGEPPPFHVTVPAIDIDWEDYTAWSDETLEDTRTLWVTDQTNQTFYVNPPREIDDDMPNFTNDKEDEDWIPDLRLHWNAAKINVYTNDVMIQPDFTIPRRHWLDSGNSEALEFKASRNTNSIPTDEVLDIRLDRMSTTGDVTSGPGGTSGTYDVIKCKSIKVEKVSVEVPSSNGVAVVRYRLHPQDAVLDSCSFSAPGKTETRNSVTGTFAFTFDQGSLTEGSTTITLQYLDSILNFTAIMTSMARGPADEVAIARIPNDPGTYSVLIEQRLREGYRKFTYNDIATILPGYYAQATGSAVSIELVDQRESFGLTGEYHKYVSQSVSTSFGAMQQSTEVSIPPTTDYQRFYHAESNLYFIPGQGMEGIAKIEVATISDIPPIEVTNQEINQELE